MRLKLEQLEHQIKQPLAPIYFISGDETLLIEEACDSIRGAAKKQGFLERERFHLDQANANWDDILQSANSLSLFSDKKLIEVRCKSNKLGDKGSKAILHYLTQPNPDIVLLIQAPKLDSGQQKSKWLKQVEAKGHSLSVWPIDRGQLPQWIQQRLSQQGMSISPDALRFLCDAVEGNLLAAKQEIDKLALLNRGSDSVSSLSLEQVSAAVSQSSRYTAFNLLDRCLAGDLAGAVRTLNGLKHEGTDASVMVWTLAKEMRQLHHARSDHQSGRPIEQIMREQRVFFNRQSAYKLAVQRLPLSRIELLLHKLKLVDHAIKGISKDDPWLLLEQLCKGICHA